MIVFDLQCGGGHVFEAWFGSSEDYEAQKARGLVQCPLCDTLEVGKAVMAPRVGAKGNAVPAADMKRMLAGLAEAQQRMLDRSDYVGERFADEARAIHLGETDARSIWGQATRDQAETLHEEGVPVAPLPFPVVPPAEKN